MDGGRRFLRSLKERFSAQLAPAPHAFAVATPLGAFAQGDVFVPRPAAKPQSERARKGHSRLDRLSVLAATPGVGALALAIVFGGSFAAGFAHSGGYESFVAENGAPGDIAARALGFPISAVTISGQVKLRENEILSAAGVDPRTSLLLLDAVDVRRRLMEVPLVKDARVLKFYPDRLVINIVEREPAALWQLDGTISVIAADGTVIDQLNDKRFLGLPFVVGEGAGQRLPEFSALVEGMGDLSGRVKAGILVSGRRWSFQMTNGVEVKLPERDPGSAIGVLLRLQREARVLDKDVISIDLRLPDRVAVRLTEEGAASLAPRKSVKTGGKS